MIVEDEYLPVLDELGFDHRVGIGDWGGASDARAFDDRPRSSDDVYMLYTGGTTGMPKGVMWRHEDFFYACCLGGSVFDPISEPAQIARNAEPSFRMSPLVLGPLMHGGGQWLTLIALWGGQPGRRLHRPLLRPDTRARPRRRRARHHDRHHRRRDGAPARGRRARRARPLGLLGDHRARQRRRDVERVGEVAARAGVPERGAERQLRRVGDRRGRERGRREHRTRPAAVLDRRPHVGARSRHPRAARGRLGRRGPVRARATSRSATGTTRSRPRRRSAPTHGVRWVVPGDWATIDAEGRIVLFGRGSGCINSGGEKIFPEEVEAAVRAHPDVFDAVVVGVPDDRFGQKVVALVKLRDGAPELTLAASRSTAARRSRATRCRASSCSARRPARTRTSPTTRLRRRLP